MQSRAKTVDQYLAELPADRRAALDALRKVIRANLDRDYEEGTASGMISYFVPLSVYPPGYHCNPEQGLPFAGLASQKSYMSLYLMSAYASSVEERFLRDGFAAAGKKLDMGKCCIRFKKLEDLPLEVIGAAIRRVPARAFVESYERARGGSGRGAAARTAGSAKRAKAGARKAAAAAAKPRRARGAR
jgi:hypothetical protein